MRLGQTVRREARTSAKSKDVMRCKVRQLCCFGQRGGGERMIQLPIRQRGLSCMRAPGGRRWEEALMRWPTRWVL